VGLGDTQQNHFFCDEIHSETSGDMLPNESVRKTRRKNLDEREAVHTDVLALELLLL
jgi:hypothetical protein